MYLSGNLHRYPPLFVLVICERRQATPRCRQNALGARNHLCPSFWLAVPICCSRMSRSALLALSSLAPGSFAVGSNFPRRRLDWKLRAILVVFLFRLRGFPRCLFSYFLNLLVRRILRGCLVFYLRLFQIFKLLEHGPPHSVTLVADFEPFL